MGWKHHKFPIGTLKTSDFFAPNLGCLCRKPRYFSSQKSDVFGFRTPFYAEIPGFSPFLPRNPQSPTLVFSLPGSPSPGLRSPSQRPKISNYSDKISILLFKAINIKNISSQEKYSVSVSFVYRRNVFLFSSRHKVTWRTSPPPMPFEKTKTRKTP